MNDNNSKKHTHVLVQVQGQFNFFFLEALNLQVLYEALQTRNGDTWEEFLFTKQLIASMDTNNDGVLDFVVNCFILIFLLFFKLFFVS